MADPFIPRSDALARQWFLAFANTIESDPARYMITPAQSASISGVVQAFVDALAISSHVATRTRPANIAKQDARRVAEQLCRVYAKLIKFNAGIGDDDKIAIGINPVSSTRRKISVPQSSPILKIVGATPHKHYLSYNDTSTPDRSAKPFGAAQLLLYRAIAEQRAKGPEQAPFYRAYTRSRMEVEFEQEHDRKVATYFACWSSRTGERGPWSLPVSMTIAA